jgi:hypothetical protein
VFVVPGLLALLALLLARPFEFVPALRELPLLYVCFGVAALGYALDLRLRLTRWSLGPHLPWVACFVVWALITALVRAPGTLAAGGVKLLVAVSIYFLLAHGVQSFRALGAVAAVLVACTVAISAICVHQGTQPFQCVAVAPGDEQSGVGTADGRSCETPLDCEEDPPDPAASYRCERAGVLGTTSIGHGRVRYVGVLNDPNETSLAVSIAIPFAIVAFQRRRSALRLLVVVASIALAAATVILSGSRSGQLVFLAVLGVYFLHRYGTRRLWLGVPLVLPVLLLGGRGGEEAASSSTERLECAAEGIQMFRDSPLLGVGYGQFTEHHTLTAHNSFVLAPAELGVLGMVAWAMVFWISFKICLAALRAVRQPEGAVAREWALALLASCAGLCVGTLFLSFNYHAVFWIVVGLTGALAGAVVRHQSDFRVHIGWKDVAGVTVGNLLLLAGLFLYLRVRGLG